VTTQIETANGTEVADQEWAGEMRYVARQAILDSSGRVQGYELRFRNSHASVPSGDGNLAAQTMLDNAVMFGLDRFTNGLPAFIPCSAEALTERYVQVLAPTRTVLEISSSLEGTPGLVDACRLLKARGFRLALDDFILKTDLEPLVRLADYIKIDFYQFGTAERAHLQELNWNLGSLIAKKVETQEDYRRASAAGFALFLGDYFCHPVLLKKTKIPANTLPHFEIARHLCHDPIEVRKISQLVKRDAALTYRLLRLVNSPIYAIRDEVFSIESAIMILGDDTFRRVVSLAIFSELNADQPPEILQMALIRGRFCEQAAKFCRLDSAEQYLLGMFSLASAMLRLPMEQFTQSLPLRNEIREALEGTKNPERRLLSWIELREHGDWAACDEIVETTGTSQERLNQCYADAVVWAYAALQPAVPCK
jgi:c-di-GMP-related signal transduction protein